MKPKVIVTILFIFLLLVLLAWLAMNNNFAWILQHANSHSDKHIYPNKYKYTDKYLYTDDDCNTNANGNRYGDIYANTDCNSNEHT